jgi:small subunit ribosomal protein S19
MAKKIIFKGKSEEEVKKLGLTEFGKLIPSRERRSLQRGFNYNQKALLKKLKTKDRVKTRSRDMVIIPEMLGKTILVHAGKEYKQVMITLEMLGHRLGEFSLTRKRVQHSAPGIGATRSSAALSTR